MRTDPKAVMMFAAGHGTRMAPLTDHTPKPLIKVDNRALIDHALDIVKGCDPIVVNTHYMADQLVMHLQDQPIQLVHEDVLLETGGGLRNALPLLGENPVFTMNTDAVWRGSNVLHVLQNAWDPSKMDALLALIPLENAVGHSGTGDFALEESGQIVRGPGLVYTGAQIIKTDRFADVKEHAFSMNVIWNQMAKDNRLFGVPYSGQWCDVGRPENIALAESMLHV